MKKELLHFSTRRLHNRPLERKDFKTWQNGIFRTNPPMNEFDSYNKSTLKPTFSTFLEILREDKSRIASGITVNFYAFRKKENDLVGGSQLWLIQRGNCQRATLGYWVLNNFWQKGFGYELAEGTIKHGIEKLFLNRVETEILHTNNVSIVLSEKLGMTCEGIRRESLFENGDWQDHRIFAITASDLGLVHRPPKQDLKSIV